MQYYIINACLQKNTILEGNANWNIVNEKTSFKENDQIVFNYLQAQQKPSNEDLELFEQFKQHFSELQNLKLEMYNSFKNYQQQIINNKNSEFTKINNNIYSDAWNKLQKFHTNYTNYTRKNYTTISSQIIMISNISHLMNLMTQVYNEIELSEDKVLNESQTQLYNVLNVENCQGIYGLKLLTSIQKNMYFKSSNYQTLSLGNLPFYKDIQDSLLINCFGIARDENDLISGALYRQDSEEAQLYLIQKEIDFFKMFDNENKRISQEDKKNENIEGLHKFIINNLNVGFLGESGKAYLVREMYVSDPKKSKQILIDYTRLRLNCLKMEFEAHNNLANIQKEHKELVEQAKILKQKQIEQLNNNLLKLEKDQADEIEKTRISHEQEIAKLDKKWSNNISDISNFIKLAYVDYHNMDKKNQKKYRLYKSNRETLLEQYENRIKKMTIRHSDNIKSFNAEAKQIEQLTDEQILNFNEKYNNLSNHTLDQIKNIQQKNSEQLKNFFQEYKIFNQSNQQK